MNNEIDYCIDRFMQKLVRVFLIGLTVVMVIGGIIAGVFDMKHLDLNVMVYERFN